MLIGMPTMQTWSPDGGNRGKAMPKLIMDLQLQFAIVLQTKTTSRCQSTLPYSVLELDRGALLLSLGGSRHSQGYLAYDYNIYLA